MRKSKQVTIFLIVFMFVILKNNIALAAPIEVNFPEGASLASSVDVFLLIAMISLLPPLFIMLTCYVKIIIVLALTRNAIGTATTPPNIVISGIAIVLTLFIMNPIIQDVKENAYDPYKEEKIEVTEAIELAEVPIKEFMVNNSSEDIIKMYAKISGSEDKISKKEDVPFLVAMASSVTTQLTQALGIGALIMLCFLMIDMITGTVLMFLGMIMLPPQMISLPIKIITFLAAGGFTLVIEILLKGIVV